MGGQFWFTDFWGTDEKGSHTDGEISAKPLLWAGDPYYQLGGL